MALVDSDKDSIGIPIEHALDQGDVADGRRGEDIGLCAPGYQILGYVMAMRPYRDHVLHSRGFVIDIPGIDVSAGLEQSCSDLNASGKVQWKLAVAPASAYKLRIAGEKFAEMLDHSQPRGRMDINDRAARDQIRRQFCIGRIEYTKAPRPPARALVDVRARVEKNVHHFPVVVVDGSEKSGRIEPIVWKGFVQARAQSRIASECLGDQRRAIGLYRCDECFDRVLRVSLNVKFQRGPGVKTILTGDYMKRIGQLWFVRVNAKGRKTV